MMTTTSLNPLQLLTVKQVAELTGMGVSTIWLNSRKGTFPQGIKVSQRCTRWKAQDIHSFIEQISQKQTPEIKVAS